MQRRAGFTLIEMLVVILLIGLLAAMAIPYLMGSVQREQIEESVALVEPFKPHVEAYYKFYGLFPSDELEVEGVPLAHKIIGNYITRMDLVDGAMHLRFGNKAHDQLLGKTLTIQPVYVEGSPQSPVSWICGVDVAPPGMRTAGDNLTDVPVKALPFKCRNRSGQQD